MLVGCTRLVPAYPRWVFAFPLAGKCKSMRVRFVLLSVVRAAARFERELAMVSLLVALSTSRGDGMFGREPQSWPIKILQRVAIE
jgi:hypothetical protein